MKVGLFGTCAESTWREQLISLLKTDYFNPVVTDWTEEAKQRELYERENCDFILYYITPRMQGVYSIAEATDDSNKRPGRTIFAFCEKDGDFLFDKKQVNSLTEVGNLVERNGGVFIKSGKLEDVAKFVNENSPRFMKWMKR